MNRLYELSGQFEELFDRLDSIDPDEENGQDQIDAWFDMLEGLELEFEQEAENFAVYIKRLRAQAGALYTEKKRLERRQKSAEAKAERMQAWLLEQMRRLRRKNIYGIKACLSVRANPARVQILDLEALLQLAAYTKPHIPKESDIDKQALVRDLKAGRAVPGAVLVRGERLDIR